MPAEKELISLIEFMTALMHNETGKAYINYSFWLKYTPPNLIILGTELKAFIRSTDEQKINEFNSIADINDEKVQK